MLSSFTPLSIETVKNINKVNYFYYKILVKRFN